MEEPARSDLQMQERMTAFRDRCRQLGLAYTYQRQVIYEEIAALNSHPTPEDVYQRVRQRIPAISLGTVYKSIRTFLDTGLLREVSQLHDSLRVDANLDHHHHVICTRCLCVFDLEDSNVAGVRIHGGLPDRFQTESVMVNVLGVCAKCQSESRTQSQQ